MEVGLTVVLVLAFGYGCYRLGYDRGSSDAKALARKRDINLPMRQCQ